MKKDSPSFCLLLYGTDNKFSTKQVRLRWQYILNGLRMRDISVLGISSDGDPRLLKAMRLEMKLGDSLRNTQIGSPEFTINDFHSCVMPPFMCVQDTVHIGTKLRARLLKSSLVLPFGNFVASHAHLEILRSVVSKDEHCLTETDLSARDKMNFASVLKICDPKTWTLLETHVPGSAATCAFLKLIYYSLNSYLNTAPTIQERIYYIWYSVFFVRMWRAWIHEHSTYSVTTNSITLNSYLCMEINAHSLVNVILKLTEQNSLEQFVPWLYSSQPCESFYRNLRSMSTTGSTIVNCTVLEAFHKLKRIQLQQDIAAMDFKSMGFSLSFPRITHLNASFETQDTVLPLPPFIDNVTTIDSQTINFILDRAKRDAFDTLSSLGLNIDITNSETIQVQNLNMAIDNFTETDINQEESLGNPTDPPLLNVFNDSGDGSNASCDADLASDLATLTTITGTLELPDYQATKKVADENGPFTLVKDSLGVEHVVRKSSICWMLNRTAGKLSSVRLERVRQSEYQRRSETQSVCSYQSLAIHTELNVGDWCLFEKEDCSSCLIGVILDFAYMDGSTWRKIEFSSNFANVSGNKETVGVLCLWYEIIEDGYLKLLELNVHGYLDIKQYRFTLPRPTTTSNGSRFDDAVLNEIRGYLP